MSSYLLSLMQIHLLENLFFFPNYLIVSPKIQDMEINVDEGQAKEEI